MNNSVQSKNKYYFFPLLLFFVTVAIFSQTLMNEFIWDTNAVIVDDPRVNSLTTSFRFFSEAYTVPGSNESADMANKLTSIQYYRPLVGIFHTIEKALFGVNPLPYKAVNLLLNGVVSLLGYFIVLNLTQNRALSLLASFFFALNPTRAEVVYWVYSDSHILVSLFILASFLLFLKGKYAFSLLTFGAGLLSQENAILLPFILAAYALFHKKEFSDKNVYKLAPYFGLTVAYLMIRHSVVGDIPIGEMSLVDRVLAVVVLLQRYIRIFLITDAPVTAYQTPENLFSLSNPETAISLVVCLLIAFSLLVLWQKRSTSLFWCVWFLVWISVTLNTGSAGNYFMAEKGLYLSGLGLSVLLAQTLLLPFGYKGISLAVAALILTSHGYQAFTRGAYWRNTTRYLEAAHKFDPDFAFYTYSLGITYNANNKHDQAIALYLKNLSGKEPGTASSQFFNLGMTESYYSLGTYLFQEKGDLEAAITAYNTSLSYNQYQPRIYNNLGNMYLIRKMYNKAIDAYKKAIELAPAYHRAYYNIALAYQGKGDMKNAMHYQQIYMNVSGLKSH